MKYFSVFSFLFLTVAMATAQTLTPSRLDFGKISTATTRSVTIKNDTSGPLVIRSVKSDCNCTTVDFSKKPIASGDSTVLRVTYTPQKGEYGVFYKVVTVATNTQKTPLEFILSGAVIQK